MQTFVGIIRSEDDLKKGLFEAERIKDATRQVKVDGAASAAPALTAHMVPATETAETNLIRGRLFILDLAFLCWLLSFPHGEARQAWRCPLSRKPVIPVTFLGSA